MTKTGTDLFNQQIEALGDNSVCPFDLCPKRLTDAPQYSIQHSVAQHAL